MIRISKLIFPWQRINRKDLILPWLLLAITGQLRCQDLQHLLDRAKREWGVNMPVSIRMEPLGSCKTLTPDSTWQEIEAAINEGRSIAGWERRETATTTFSVIDGPEQTSVTSRDAIVLNSNCHWQVHRVTRIVPFVRQGVPLYELILHEYGHRLGVPHNLTDRGSVMFPAPSWGATITSEDRKGIK